MKWRIEGNRAEWLESYDTPIRPALQAKVDGLKVTYIGHATILVQMEGLNILTDPVFSDRCSPISFAGPKRVVKPFIGLKDLPKIDCVFVSHNHYDHLDLPSLAWLARNHKPALITPLGNARLIKPCIEQCALASLDWHESTPLGGGTTLTVTPSQHWSRRGFNDINRDLWGDVLSRTAKVKASIFAVIPVSMRVCSRTFTNITAHRTYRLFPHEPRRRRQNPHRPAK